MFDVRPLFFSIVIPAHNEEKYLAATLEYVCMLDYPKDSFEAIVVENGSTDRTLEIARTFKRGNVRVLQSEKGVSRAKNAGLANVNKKSDWVVFLDADTVLERAFLSELNSYFQTHRENNLAIGTTSIKPLEKKHWYVPLWFAFHNLTHRLTHSSFAIQIMRASLRENVRFDEHIQFAEDLKLIKDARRFGRFFFVPTGSVSTSTRRFETLGWMKLMFVWIFDWLVLSRTKKHREDAYQVIR